MDPHKGYGVGCLLKFVSFYFVSVYVWVHEGHHAYMEVRGVDSLLLPHGSWDLAQVVGLRANIFTH